MSRKAMQVALEALESDPISHAGPVTVLSPGKGTGCGYTNINENWTPLYTAPQKQWVGLTLNEAKDFYDKYTDRAELINAIDKFLEEKNHGH